MSKSKIEWTEKVWNPVTGCTKVSPGCEHCYAMRQAFRLEHMGQKDYAGTAHKTAGGKIVWTGKVNMLEHKLNYPLHIKKPTKFFVNSMSDLFHEDVPFEFIDRVFLIMASTPHIYQILTKRPERMLEFAKQNPMTTSTNVWLGVSVENQETADERIPILLQIPAAVRWLSCEPLLGEIDLNNIKIKEFDSESIWEKPSIIPDETIHNTHYLNAFYGGERHESSLGVGIIPDNLNKRIHWVVVGGESGPGARPMHPDWARKIRNDCAAAGVPFFFKQWGEWCHVANYPRTIADKGQIYMWPDGEYRESNGMGFPANSNDVTIMEKLGKKLSGRLLDGVEWNSMPGKLEIKTNNK